MSVEGITQDLVFILIETQAMIETKFYFPNYSKRHSRSVCFSNDPQGTSSPSENPDGSYHSDNKDDGDDKKRGYCHPPHNSPARDPNAESWL